MSRSTIIFGILLSLFIFGSAQGATYYVPDDYPTIQDGINACLDGDTLIVRNGTYYENIDFIGKAITVTSENGPYLTAIDGGQAASTVLFVSREGADSVLDGFTITNGKTVNYYWGGGIHCNSSSPTIKNNIVSGNTSAYEGGGILCISSCSPTITDNIIERNNAHDGSGISCLWGGDATISNNVIRDNSGNNAAGIHCNGANPVIANNLIHGNDTLIYSGGGINCGDSSPLIVNNVINNNQAVNEGGGIFADYGSSPTIVNNTIYYNYADSGGGIYVRGTSVPMVIVNTILWNNLGTDGPELVVGDPTYPATVDISYCDVDGGMSSCMVDPSSTLNWGAGMIDSDPVFADYAKLDLHLTYYSPYLNAGSNAAPGIQTTDFEGDDRTAMGTTDIGADEFYFHLYSTGSITPGAAIDVRVVGSPGSGPVMLALGSGIKDPPQTTPYGYLYLVLPPVKTFILGQVPGSGVLVRPATVPTSWQTGQEQPFQALIGPIGNPGSVLTNLMIMKVE